MKRFLLMLVTVAFAMNAQAGANPWLKSLDAAQKEARKRNALIFVDLFAEWCGWCHRAEQEVFPSEPFQKATDDMVLLRLDTEDRAEGTKFAQTLGITSLPTFVIVTPDLMLAGMIRGYAPPAPFANEVGKARTKFSAFESDLKKDWGTNYTKQVELAEQLIAFRGFAKAEPRLRTLISSSAPNDVKTRAQYNLAEAQRGQKKYNDARATISGLEKMKLDAATAERAAFLRASLFLDEMKWAPALDELKKFKTKYPKSSQIPYVDYLIPQLQSAIQRAQ